MKVTNQPNINLTTAWTEVTSNSVIRFLGIYVTSGNINIQVYDNNGYGSTTQKNNEEIFTYFQDIKKFRIAAQAGTAIVNYFYQEETLQITAQTEKASPHDNDIVIVEDSEDSLKQKKVKMSNIKTPPRGLDTQLQFNDGALFGGIPELVYDKSLKNIKIPTKFVICGTFTSDGINSAIDELGSTGGEVYLPEGEYAITSTITIDYNNTTLSGAGNGTYLNATTYNGHVIDCNGKSDLLIRNFKIRGSAGSGYTQNLIDEGTAITSYRVRIEGMYLYDADNFGIGFDSADYVNFRDHVCINNYVDNSDGAGIIFYKNRCIIINNTVVGQGIHAGQYMVVNNNTVISSADRGIYAQTFSNVVGNVVRWSQIAGIGTNGQSCVVEGNKVIECVAGHGFEIIANDYGTVSNNVTQGNANNKVGFYIASTNYCTINGNSDRSWAGREDWGIYLDGCDYNTVQDNVIFGHDNGGIYLAAASNNNHIVNNNLEGEAVIKITDAGTNNTIINSITGNTSWLKDNAKVIFGAASDASIYYDGIDMNIKTDEVAASNLKVHTGAAKTLELLTPVYDSLNFTAINLKLGASPPDLINILGSGGLYGYAFDGLAILEEVLGGGGILHSYKEGTDLAPHIHWMPTDANSGNVKWFLEYSIINKEGTFSAPTIISIVDVADGTAWKHQFINFSAISGIGLEIGSHIIFRIYRDPSDVDDTYGQDAVLLSFGLHYQKCRLGSRQPTIA